MRVAFLGTGIMGAPMARNVRAAGHEVSAWNRTRAKAEPLAQEGVTVAGSVAEAVAGADEVLGCLEACRVDTLLLGEGFRASGVAERATEKALESSAEVVVIRHHDLGPHDSIAALLRY